MRPASYYRVKGEASDLPLMLWPDEGGDFIVQVGRSRPWQSFVDRRRFAHLVTDLMWLAEPVTRAEYDAAMEAEIWPDGRSSMETK